MGGGGEGRKEVKTACIPSRSQLWTTEVSLLWDTGRQGDGLWKEKPGTFSHWLISQVSWRLLSETLSIWSAPSGSRESREKGILGVSGVQWSEPVGQVSRNMVKLPYCHGKAPPSMLTIFS